MIIVETILHLTSRVIQLATMGLLSPRSFRSIDRTHRRIHDLHRGAWPHQHEQQ